MRAFVTGATGFVGNHVARALLRSGVTVRALVRESSNTRNLDDLDVEIVYGDLLDKERLPDLLKGCDELYHVAAYYSTRPEDGPIMYQINVQGTKNLLMAAYKSGVRRVVHTSTIGTIGHPASGELPTEEVAFNLWETSSDYVKSKYLGEKVALSMMDYGLEVVVVHPCAPVGPRDIKPTSTGQRIVDYLKGKRSSFPPGGINFIAVEDVAEGHLLAARKGRAGERYILGNAEANLTQEAFMRLMEKVSGLKPPREPLIRPWSILQHFYRQHPPSQKGHLPSALTCDPQKAIRELGLPQTPIEVALAAAVRWFKENGYVES